MFRAQEILVAERGIFADGHYGAGWNGSPVSGVKGIIVGEWGQLGIQALGAVVIWTVIFGVAFSFSIFET